MSYNHCQSNNQRFNQLLNRCAHPRAVYNALSALGSAGLLIKEKAVPSMHQVCDEAREAFPERFAGKTDQEIAKEIAEVVQNAERAAQGGTNTQDGMVDTSDQTVSISNDTREKRELQA